MDAPCLDKTLLEFNGTSQARRVLEALAASYAKVDSRTDADLILFAKKYSSYLNFYDLTNTIAGDWTDLMGKEVAVTIAALADWHTKDFIAYIHDLYNRILSAGSATPQEQVQQDLKFIFDFIFSLATGLHATYLALPDDNRFKEYLKVAIASRLARPLNILMQYYKGSGTSSPMDPPAINLIDPSSTTLDPLVPFTGIFPCQNFVIDPGKDLIWTSDVTAASIILNGSVVIQTGQLITHNLFTGPVNSFIDGVTNIVGQVPAFLQEVLENYPSHNSHYALYLSFLRLFRFAQEHLNEFTQNHLDFYYKDGVLQLENKPAIPDFVHLVFELQKNTPEHLLSKGIAFKAGKDRANNDLFYALCDDILIKQSEVKSLKSLFLKKELTPGQKLFASPVSNSQDGLGAKLIGADKSWAAFGETELANLGELGFLIASNVLYLNEGSRHITMTFYCKASTKFARETIDLTNAFSFHFSGKKSWFEPDAFLTKKIIKFEFDKDRNTYSLTFDLTLNGSAPPIIPYSQKTHGGNYPDGLPMVKVMLKDFTGNRYLLLKSLVIEEILVDVTVQNVKNLVLQNDNGNIDPAKPFKLFGEFPDNGSYFILGSKEIFQKKVSALKINIVWKNVPSLDVDRFVLCEGQWESVASPIVTLFSDPLTKSIPFHTSYDLVSGYLQKPLSQPDFGPNELYQISSVDGFIKIQVSGPDTYSLKTYLNDVQDAVAEMKTTITTTDTTTTFQVQTPGKVVLPPAPVASSLDVSYTAAEKIVFPATSRGKKKYFKIDSRSDFFYHVEPFGFRAMSPSLTEEPIRLLPVFNVDDGNPAGHIKAGHDGGELWIGLAQASPGDTFSLLFQVAEGTANPLKEITDVVWYYLSENNWIKFGSADVTDDTNSLTKSGLVVLQTPYRASLNNTRADSGLLWIKAVVQHDADAVCNLITVRANAAKGIFVDNKEKKIELTQPLLPNTISKPVIADGKIKKIDQPYPSFDGRYRETDAHFYLRVSERLRHKSRAWTLWDYERLVLQEFPSIHLVKCINHTGFILNSSKTPPKKRYSEVLPGHLMVVTIPDLTGLATSNPLLPYTGLGVLADIRKYLQNLISPFIKLEVTNPQFEQVQFTFDVKYRTTANYNQTLIDEIEKFLTPWASGSGGEIEFGGTIEKSVVLKFIEKRPYVDYVNCLKMYQYIPLDDGTFQKSIDLETAIASTARSILVSYYDPDSKTKHIINAENSNCKCNE
ncbi:MAG: hypothetical protein NTX61_05540 [Bacteroidetes bacterium]|nr:hypothetical protein [Bacteroidota bacterium]